MTNLQTNLQTHLQTNSGSSYETYDKTHTDYDKTRLAVGNEQLVAMLGPDIIKTLRILDAGCGTGVHLSAFVHHGISGDLLTGLDASVTGLAQAAQKLPAHAANVGLICGDIRSMPFAPESFDLILFSFVLHHLPLESQQHQQQQVLLAEATRAVLSRAAPLLAVGGRLAIITCTPEQLLPASGCMWYYKYFPEAAEKLAARFLPPEILTESLTQAGFVITDNQPVHETYWTAASLDAEGPFDPTWRSGDSLFALCAQDQTLFAKQLQQLRDDITSGAADTHIKMVRQRAERVKQATLILAVRQ